MENITLVGQWLAQSFLKLWNAIGTWGVIGFGIIALPILYKLANIAKKIFNF